MTHRPRTSRALIGTTLAVLAITALAGDAPPTTAPARPDLAPLLAKLAIQDAKQTKAALEALGQSGDPRVAKFLKEYFMKSSAYVYDGKVVLKGPSVGDKVRLLDPLTGQPIVDPKGEPLAVAAADVK